MRQSAAYSRSANGVAQENANGLADALERITSAHSILHALYGYVEAGDHGELKAAIQAADESAAAALTDVEGTTAEVEVIEYRGRLSDAEKKAWTGRNKLARAAINLGQAISAAQESLSTHFELARELESAAAEADRIAGNK